LTIFVETLRSTSPPPTEKIRIASSGDRLLTSSQPEKIVSQPSSFARAVSSDTLSTGLYAWIPHSLRKSFTAWLQLPALPPTPSRKRRPLRSLRTDSWSAIASIVGYETVSQMLLASSKNCWACDIACFHATAVRVNCPRHAFQSFVRQRLSCSYGFSV